RLSVVCVELPPLRDRKEDIPALAQSFCSRLSLAHGVGVVTISQPVYQRFYEYEWPGNVRQLRNCIERAVVLCEGQTITLNVLPQEIQHKYESAQAGSGMSKEDRSIEGAQLLAVSGSLKLRAAKREFELRYIERVLEQTSGNITQAAGVLGI